MIWAGLAMQGAGNVGQAFGDAESGRAIERAWREALHRQEGYDNQAHERTLSFLNGMSPDLIAGTGRNNEIANRLQASSATVGKAVAAKAAKGGRNAPLAGDQQRLADMLRSQGQMDAIEARNGGFAAGMQDLSNMSGAYRGDRARITRDAELWQQLLPYQLRVASSKGANWRNAGQELQVGGSALTNWAMSQPRDGGTSKPNELASTPGVAGVQAAAPSWQQPAQWQMGGSMTDVGNPFGVQAAHPSWQQPAQWQMGGSMTDVGNPFGGMATYQPYSTAFPAWNG